MRFTLKTVIFILDLEKHFYKIVNVLGMKYNEIHNILDS